MINKDDIKREQASNPQEILSEAKSAPDGEKEPVTAALPASARPGAWRRHPSVHPLPDGPVPPSEPPPALPAHLAARLLASSGEG
jgi:hypothetical protein